MLIRELTTKPIEITLSEDKMDASISIYETPGGFPDEEQIYQAIQEAGIIFGINHEIIGNLVREQHYCKDVLFARGIRSFSRDEGELIWYTDISESARPTIDEFGKADFKHLKKLEFVKAGQELVSFLPSQNAQPGTTVTGENSYSMSDNLKQLSGKNIRLTDDGLSLTSTIDGYVYWKLGRLQVDNIYHITGDVDFSTGNVKFDGTILIDGDVRSGFRVDATESIYVRGNVEAAEIYSERGDIVVKLGILGRNRAKVLAGGSFYCRFLQDATVAAKKDIIVEHYAINSHVSAGGKVYLIQNEGLIRGGRTFADEGMRAIEIGSRQNIPTDIGISGFAYHQMDTRTFEIDRLIEETLAKLNMNTKRLEFLRLLRERLPELSETKQKELQEIEQQVLQYQEQIETLKIEKEQLMGQKEDPAHVKAIEVIDKIHRGVTITIGDQKYRTQQTLTNVRIYRQENRIVSEKLANTYE